MGNTMTANESKPLSQRTQMFSNMPKEKLAKKLETQKCLKHVNYGLNQNVIHTKRVNDDLDQNNIPTRNSSLSDGNEENMEANDLKNYTFLKTIGKGNFGKVLLVKSKIDKNLYALKCLKKE